MKTLISFCVVVAMMAVIVLALMHGMVSEVEIRELKADRRVFNQILADKALAERAVDRELSSRPSPIASRLPSSWSR